MKKESLVPKVRFKGFSDPWEQRKLGELSRIVRGASPRPIKLAKWFDTRSKIGWLRISDVSEQNGRIHKLSQHISAAGQAKTRVLQTEHLLLSIAATVGKPVLNYIPTGVHDGFLIFMEPQFDLEFMYQWLDSIRYSWKRYGQPGSQVNLNSELVRNKVIGIPELNEQKSIGTIIKQVDNLIAANEDKLEQLKKLKKLLMQKIFSQEWRFKGFTDPWEQRKLGQVATIQGGGTPSSSNSDYWNGEINWFTPTEVYNQGFLCESKRKITALGLKKSSARLLPTGTILLTSRAGVGDMGILTEKAATNQGFQSIIPQKDIPSYFIFTLQPLISKIANKLASGSTFTEISNKSVAKIAISIPIDSDERNDIAKMFFELDQLIAANEEKLSQLKELKKFLMQNMFV